MDQRALEIRRNQWKDIVVEVNRSGMPKKDWCKEHGISVRQFYYWQAKLRTEVIEEMGSALPPKETRAATPLSGESGFLELNMPGSQRDSYIVETESAEAIAMESCYKEKTDPEMVLQYGMFRMLIGKGIREETLRTVIRVVKDA